MIRMTTGDEMGAFKVKRNVRITFPLDVTSAPGETSLENGLAAFTQTN